jgi:hypothetical protein
MQNRLLLIATVATLLLGSAQSQETSSVTEFKTTDCLVRLKSPDAGFAQKLDSLKATVLSHSSDNSNWHVRVSQQSCNVLHSVPDIDRVETAVSLIVTLEDGAVAPQKEIESLGGIVERQFENLSAASVVVPEAAVSGIAKLPHVLRVRKDYPVSATQKSE